MKQWMPGDQGWVDRSPTPDPSHLPGHAGPVVVTKPLDGGPATWSTVQYPYDLAEVDAIVKAGKIAPRWLSLEDSRRASRNRQAYLAQFARGARARKEEAPDE